MFYWGAHLQQQQLFLAEVSLVQLGCNSAGRVTLLLCMMLLFWLKDLLGQEQFYPVVKQTDAFVTTCLTQLSSSCQD